MSTDPVTGSISMVLDIFERVAPSGLAFIKTQFTGKKITIVGPTRAGKTCFKNYLRHGILTEELEMEKSYKMENTSAFTIKKGGQNSLLLQVKKVYTIPGQAGAEDQAEHVYRIKSHALLVFLDVDVIKTKQYGYDWLKEFVEHFEQKWRISRRKRNPIQFISIMLNKKDKVKDDEIQQSIEAVKAIIDPILQFAKGNSRRPIMVMPCIAVVNPERTKYMDSIITQMALALTE